MSAAESERIIAELVAENQRLRAVVEQQETVYVHDSHCNDYTGCNDGCGRWPKTKAVYRMGAWRRA